jgi:L-ascorbate metabolism protein UlaG (beta-lactamase superfamily)
MKIRLVRHATLVVQLDSRTVLIDPMLGPVEEFFSFQPSPNNQRNPLVPLPDPDPSSVLSSVDTCFVTHTHLDHFDQAAINALRKDLPIVCQPEDEEKLRSTFGFSSVQPVEENLQSDGIEVFRTGGQHGPGNRDGLEGPEHFMGPVSGFVLRSRSEPSLYVAGDTIWCQEVEEALDRHQPEVVVVNAGAAQLTGGVPITMTREDVAEVCRYLPNATVVAVHMEAINHCPLTRKVLEDFVKNEELSDRVHIPADGEDIEF